MPIIPLILLLVGLFCNLGGAGVMLAALASAGLDLGFGADNYYPGAAACLVGLALAITGAIILRRPRPAPVGDAEAHG